MTELNILQKFLIFALGALWIISAFRVGRMARFFNRNPLKWFCITIFFSALPATIAFWADQRKRITAQKSRPQETLMRCPHCGEVITNPDDTTDQGECPNCKQIIDERYLA